jgi:transposase
MVENIRLLKCAKDSATDSRTRAINQIKAILGTAPGPLREGWSLAPQRTDHGLWRSLARPAVRTHGRYQANTGKLARFIQALEKKILELLADLGSLTQVLCTGLWQRYSVGDDGAAILLTATGDNPQRIRSEVAFAELCGVNPLPASPC